MPYLRDILRRLPRQPSRWLVLLAAAAYLMLPGLFVGHLLVAHVESDQAAEPRSPDSQAVLADEACATVTVILASTAPDAPAEPHSPDSDHAPTCDLCLLLAKVACGGPVASVNTAVLDQPVPIGRIFGIDQPLLGARIPVAVQPRAPPRL